MSEKVGTRINAEAQQRGLFSRNRGDIYMLAPPFVITTEQIDRIVASLTAPSMRYSARSDA